MIHLGYRIYEHRSHAGSRWGWYSPFGAEGTHMLSEDYAWKAAEKDFVHKLTIVEKLLELLKGLV